MPIYQLPLTVDHLLEYAHLPETLATQVLAFVMQSSRCDDVRLRVLNYILEKLDQHGLDAWQEIRCDLLVTRVQQLTQEINHTVQACKCKS